jgi:glycosyltransferase involved in cell wall biosynthesis
VIPILEFVNTYARGGVEEHVLTLLRKLDRNQFRPALACTPAVAALVRGDLPGDVELLEIELNRPAQLRAMRRLAGFLRARRTGILHCHMFQSSVFAAPIAKLCRVPVVIETPHVRELWRGGWIKGRYFVDRWVGHAVDRYIAVSSANARYLAGEKGLPERKISVVHNGADLGRFDPLRTAPPGMKASLGFDAGDPILAVVGRLEPQKGHAVLLDAMPAILRQHPRARLVCVGDGALRRQLERQTRDFGLGDAVRFTGFRSDVAAWMALADVMVLPSFFEGLPLVAIEAMAAARPVVATAVDGTPEVVLDGETGLTVPPGNPEALAAAVCRLLADPLLRWRMGWAGRRRALGSFTQERFVRDTQDVYLTAWRHAHARSTAAYGLRKTRGAGGSPE